MVVVDQAMGFCRRSLALGGRRLPKMLVVPFQKLPNLIEGHRGAECLLIGQKARYCC